MQWLESYLYEIFQICRICQSNGPLALCVQQQTVRTVGPDVEKTLVGACDVDCAGPWLRWKMFKSRIKIRPN